MEWKCKKTRHKERDREREKERERLRDEERLYQWEGEEQSERKIRYIHTYREEDWLEPRIGCINARTQKKRWRVRPEHTGDD